MQVTKSFIIITRKRRWVDIVWLCTKIQVTKNFYIINHKAERDKNILLSKIVIRWRRWWWWFYYYDDDDNDDDDDNNNDAAAADVENNSTYSTSHRNTERHSSRFFTVSSLCSKLFSTCTPISSRHSCVQIVCSTLGVHQRQHVCHMVWEDSSAIILTELKSHLFLVLFHLLKSSTNEGGEETRGWYHGGRRLSSDDSLHSPTVIPPSALDKPSIMKRYHRRRTCSQTSPHRSTTMVTLHDTWFVECQWWNDGWTVKTVVTWWSLASMIPAPEYLGEIPWLWAVENASYYSLKTQAPTETQTWVSGRCWVEKRTW